MEPENALAILREEADRRRVRSRRLLVASVVLIGIQAAMFGYMVARDQGDLSVWIALMATAISLLGIGAGFSPRAKATLLGSEATEDVRWVGPLVEALGSGDPELTKLARERLTVLLPMLGDDAPRLDRVQHAAFALAVQTQPEPFVAALLAASPKIGRAETAGVLEGVSARRVSPSLAAVAREALPELRLQLAREIVARAVAEADARRAALGAPRFRA